MLHAADDLLEGINENCQRAWAVMSQLYSFIAFLLRKMLVTQEVHLIYRQLYY